jgi:UDP-N-acetyl-2-amino-2-deoxyglucuronate dehydrogenase
MLLKRDPISDRKLRFALVGCGRIAQYHIAALLEHSSEAEWVGICDQDKAALERVAQNLSFTAYTDINALLKYTDADLVVLTSPSGLHATQAIVVAESGRHVMTEKPMATCWQDGVRMVQACDKAGVHLFVVKQNRYNATLQCVRKAIDEGRFGRIYMVTMNVFWARPQSYYDSAPWRGTVEYDGGVFMNQASHYVDLADWLIGPVDSVHAYMGTLAREVEVEDTGVLSLRWRSGAMGSLNVTVLNAEKDFEGSITIIGEKGSVRVGGVALNQIQQWDFVETKAEDKNIFDANYAISSVYGVGHPLYYKNVIEVLRGRATPDVDGREGLKSLSLLAAAYRSARDGMRVGLPLGER